jgi:hypothetical protein
MAVKRRGAKQKRPRKRGIPRLAYQDIMQGLGGEHDPVATYRDMNKRQRRGARRKARARGKTLQGVLSGGPTALQERSAFGIRRQAIRTIKSAYAPAEAELGRREQQENALYMKREQDEAMYNQWVMAEQAKMRARAATADQAYRDALTANQLQEQSVWQAAQASPEQGVGADAQGAQAYGQRQIGLASAAAQGASSAARQRGLSEQASGAQLSGAYDQSLLADAGSRRRESRDRFYQALDQVAAEKRDLKLRRAADLQKETRELQDQAIEVGQANREWSALKRELGLKGYEARTERRVERGKLRETRRQNRIAEQLKRIDLRLKSRDLTRKEQDLLEKRRHNLATEANALRKGKGASKPTAGEKKAWATVDQAAAQGKRIKAKRGLKTVGQLGRALRREGYGAVAARAAAELAIHGKVSRETRRRLRESGGYTPRQYR